MSWTLAVVAAVVLVYAVLARRLDRAGVTPAIFFVSCALALGGKSLGWIDLAPNGTSIHVLAEVTLTLVLFTDASRIDLPALRREYLVPLRLLAIGLPLTILAGWATAAWILPNLSLGEALVLAIILAPTDAALGQAVVADPRLPSRIRQGLNVESGLNDGICVPLLVIAIGLSEAEAHTSSVSSAVEVTAKAIGYGVLFGVLCGAAGGILLRLGAEHEWTDTIWTQLVPVATAALAYGTATPTGGSGFIAAFVAGLSFGIVLRGREVPSGALEDLADLANAGTFIVFGAAIAGAAVAAMSWREGLYAVVSLTVVRMVPVALALARTGARPPTTAFVGWFGPRGLASIVFLVIVVEETSLPNLSVLEVAVVCTILLSVYAHGLTARPLTARYAEWYRRHPNTHLPMESVHAPPHRPRSARLDRSTS